jgi:hypothetical protein
MGGEKWPAIDLVKLIANHTYKDWNKYLGKCEFEENVTSLVSTYYGLQKGMQVAVVNKMNTPFVVQTFIRLQKSLEKTLKKIYIKKYKSPCDNPLQAAKFKEHLQKKRDRDHEFEKWLKGMRY